MLDLTPFRNAIAQLEQTLRDIEEYPQLDSLRDAAIQRFEFTYDLCPKMLKRMLLETDDTEDHVASLTVAGLFRRASELSLTLHDWSQWQKYREARNITSHTYDRKKAEEVFAIIPAFLDDARFLLDRMADRLNA